MTNSSDEALLALLRLIAAAAPNPWYPSEYARNTNIPRDSLDVLLEKLRLGGMIRLTDWTQDYGQGYVLTPEAVQLLRQQTAPGQPSHPAFRDPALRERALAIKDALTKPSRPVVSWVIILVNLVFFGYALYLASAQNLFDDVLNGGGDIRILEIMQQDGAINRSDILPVALNQAVVAAADLLFRPFRLDAPGREYVLPFHGWPLAGVHLGPRTLPGSLLARRSGGQLRHGRLWERRYRGRSFRGHLGNCGVDSCVVVSQSPRLASCLHNFFDRAAPDSLCTQSLHHLQRPQHQPGRTLRRWACRDVPGCAAALHALGTQLAALAGGNRSACSPGVVSRNALQSSPFRPGRCEESRCHRPESR